MWEKWHGFCVIGISTLLPRVPLTSASAHLHSLSRSWGSFHSLLSAAWRWRPVSPSPPSLPFPPSPPPRLWARWWVPGLFQGPAVGPRGAVALQVPALSDSGGVIEKALVCTSSNRSIFLWNPCGLLEMPFFVPKLLFFLIPVCFMLTMEGVFSLHYLSVGFFWSFTSLNSNTTVPFVCFYPLCSFCSSFYVNFQ